MEPAAAVSLVSALRQAEIAAALAARLAAINQDAAREMVASVDRAADRMASVAREGFGGLVDISA